jgi:putative heme-binding domain-containing protein
MGIRMDRRPLAHAAVIAGLLALVPAAARDEDSARRADYARSARSARGDAGRGRALFFDASRLACARCHRVRGEGGELGPDLSDVGGKLPKEVLIEAVLDPSRQVVEGYRETVLATADGRVLSGIVKEETADALTLVDAELRRLVVRKSDVEARRVGDGSIMPAGLAAGISRDEFADLIAFLETLRSAGQGTPGSGVYGPVALPPGFRHRAVASGISGATAMAVAPDGRVFVCEQAGALRVVKGDALLSEPFVTLEVDSRWERGLIGVALDPDFARNGFVYVNYAARRPYTHHRVSRLTAAGDVAAPGSEVVLLEGDDQGTLGGRRPDGHQGGALHFGGDGKLYVAIGDQTAGEPSQHLDTLQGKLLRLNADGSIPRDNPFYRSARGKYRAIWALGLRNPFSFAVQPGTGRIFINDVGETRWEEVDEGVAGANYGWPATEGPTDDPRFRGPIHHYPVASVAGGAFCPTDRGYPPQFGGKYFFMDFVKGWIKALDPDRPERVEAFASGLTRPVDLAFAADGSLYVLLRDAWVIDENFRPATGSLLRIRSDASAEAAWGQFYRLHWFEHGEEHGNPSSAHNGRFRVNAPEVVTHPTFGARAEARGSGMLQILMEEDPRVLAGADLYLELWGGHPGTAGRRVTLNGRTTYAIDDPGGDRNCTHLYPTIGLKAADLVNGYNALQFACDQGTSFWGHFIVDEACLRAALRVDHPDLARRGLGGFAATVATATLDRDAEAIALALDVPESSRASVASVDFQGRYWGYDENGDGREADWHGFTKHRKPMGYIGAATAAPFSARFDLSMLPDQEDMAVRAIVHFKGAPDLVYVTPEARGLRTPGRARARVRTYPATDLPEPFWSRAGRKKSCTLALDVDPGRIERAELHVAIWDGGRGTVADYFTLNGRALPVAASGRHDVIYSVLRLDPAMLRRGANRIELLSDTEHHGLEVLLPGPALVVRTKPPD